MDDAAAMAARWEGRRHALGGDDESECGLTRLPTRGSPPCRGSVAPSEHRNHVAKSSRNLRRATKPGETQSLFDRFLGDFEVARRSRIAIDATAIAVSLDSIVRS